MANKKIYQNPFRVIFYMESQTVGKLDELALKNNTSRTTELNAAVNNHLKSKK